MVYACGLCILSGKVLTCCRRSRICMDLSCFLTNSCLQQGLLTNTRIQCDQLLKCELSSVLSSRQKLQREEISSYLWDYYYCGHPNVRSLVAAAGWIRNLGDSRWCRCVVVNPIVTPQMDLGWSWDICKDPGDLWTKWLTAISGWWRSTQRMKTTHCGAGTISYPIDFSDLDLSWFMLEPLWLMHGHFTICLGMAAVWVWVWYCTNWYLNSASVVASDQCPGGHELFREIWYL